MKKNLYTALIFFTLAGFFFALPHFAFAADVEKSWWNWAVDIFSDGAATAAEWTGDAVAWAFGEALMVPIAAICMLVLKLVSLILWIAGVMLNLSIDISINYMKGWIDGIPAIHVAWTTIRDLCNIVFIFILLWIGVNTILGTRNRATSSLLTSVIMVALLINFSFFFTSVLIDTSNVLTLQFYRAIPQTTADPVNVGISGVFNNRLNLTTAFGNELGLKNLLVDPKKVAMMSVLGIILELIAAFVFFAAAILFIIRLVVLIFLLITSPFGYIGTLLPRGAGLASKWWSILFDQLIFAPVMMMFFWIAAKILNDPTFNSSLQAVGFAGVGQAQFSDLVLNNSENAVKLIVMYSIVIIFLIMSMIAAKSMGAKGASFATATAGAAAFGLAGLAGRQTVGRGFNVIANTKAMKNFAANRPVMGGLALRAARGVAGSNFDLRGAPLGAGKAIGAGKSGEGMFIDAKGGHAGFLDRKSKADADFAKSLGTDLVFKNKKAEERYKQLTEKNKTDTEEKNKKQTRFTELKAVDEKVRTPEQNAEMAKLADAIKELDESIKGNEKELKFIATNPDVALSRQATYAENLQESGKATTLKTAGMAGAGAVVGGMMAGPVGAAVGAAVGAGVKMSLSEISRATYRKVKDTLKKDSRKDLAKAMKDMLGEDEDDKDKDKPAASGGSSTPPPAGGATASATP